MTQDVQTGMTGKETDTVTKTNENICKDALTSVGLSADYLKVPEVAKILRVPRTRAYELIGRGEIPGVIRIGRSIRINRAIFVESLQEWASQEHYRG